MPDTLAALDASNCYAVSVVRSGDAWQANLEVERGSYRIRHGSTPSAALAALFQPVPVYIPPPPY